MEFKKCCTVKYPEMIQEEYQLTEGGILANIPPKKVKALFDSFVTIHKGEKYFVLELPLQIQVNNGKPQQMMEVYYLDGCSNKDLEKVWSLLRPWLENDGMIQFGVGCHDKQDELLFMLFNSTAILTTHSHPYTLLMMGLQIPKTHCRFSFHDTIHQGNTAHTELYRHWGKDIRSMLPKLKKMGFYLAEVRPLQAI